MSRHAQMGVPDAWPSLMTRQQLCAYLGLPESRFTQIYTVPPVDLGGNILRYARAQADAWVAGLPPRLPKALQSPQNAPPLPPPEFDGAQERRAAALARVRSRIERGRCKTKSRSSSASAARADE